ncbi:hypothetical protein P9112_008789 [Eukaryota sp. TZLM1-RC]
MLAQYEILSVIGEGAYGVVLKCRNKETSKTVAIKKFKNTDHDDENTRKTTLREVKLLRMLRHNNIVKLIEAFRRKGRLYLVFNYAERNMLEVLESSRGGLGLKKVRWFTYQLLKALSWVHQNGILHRDIKLENLLVTNDDTLLLCDFGFARTVNNRNSALTEYVSTRWYRSPSLLLGLPYTSAVDIWATGCVMAELATGEPLFPGDSDVDQMNLIASSIGPLPSCLRDSYLRHPAFRSTSRAHRRRQTNRDEFFKRLLPVLTPVGVDLLQKMLDLDEGKIISAEDALNHPFFEGIEEEYLASMRPDSCDLRIDTEPVTEPRQRKRRKDVVFRNEEKPPCTTVRDSRSRNRTRQGSPHEETPSLFPSTSTSRLQHHGWVSPSVNRRRGLRETPSLSIGSPRQHLPNISDAGITQIPNQSDLIGRRRFDDDAVSRTKSFYNHLPSFHNSFPKTSSVAQYRHVL